MGVMHSMASLEQAVDGVRQLAVALGHHMAHVMGVQLDADVAVLVVEDRVMALLLGEECDPRHKGEGLSEILESELPDEAIVLFHPHGDVLSAVKVAPGVGIRPAAPNFASMDSRPPSPRPIAFAPPLIDEAAIQAVERVLRSGWITTGPETAAFEEELAAFCGVPKVVCGGSWTGLAGVIFDWFGVGPGDEVILPSYTYCATANVVLQCGAEPVLVDLPDPEEEDGFNLTWAAIEPHLTTRTKVVMPVDVGGWPVALTGWKDRLTVWAQEHGFEARHPTQERLGRPLLLLDAAHSLGATLGGQPVAPMSDIAVYSFHAVKNLTTAEGGAAALALPPSFEADEVHRTLRTLCLHGQSKDAATKFNSSGRAAWRYDVTTAGFKCNMTDIQAALGRSALDRYPADLEWRHALCDRYDAGFAGWDAACLPRRTDASRRGANHLYLLRLPRLDEAGRDALIDRLSAEGVATNVHFQPLPLLTVHAERGERIEDHPNAHRAYACEISLPVHMHLTLDDVDRVVAAVRQGHDAILNDGPAQ